VGIFLKKKLKTTRLVDHARKSKFTSSLVRKNFRCGLGNVTRERALLHATNNTVHSHLCWRAVLCAGLRDLSLVYSFMLHMCDFILTLFYFAVVWESDRRVCAFARDQSRAATYSVVADGVQCCCEGVLGVEFFERCCDRC